MWVPTEPANRVGNRRRRCEFAMFRDTRNASALRPVCCAVFCSGSGGLRCLVVLFDLYKEWKAVPYFDCHAHAIAEARQVFEQRRVLLA